MSCETDNGSANVKSCWTDDGGTAEAEEVNEIFHDLDDAKPIADDAGDLEAADRCLNREVR